jgi:hypothetical protein
VDKRSDIGWINQTLARDHPAASRDVQNMHAHEAFLRLKQLGLVEYDGVTPMSVRYIGDGAPPNK